MQAFLFTLLLATTALAQQTITNGQTTVVQGGASASLSGFGTYPITFTNGRATANVTITAVATTSLSATILAAIANRNAFSVTSAGQINQGIVITADINGSAILTVNLTLNVAAATAGSVQNLVALSTPVGSASSSSNLQITVPTVSATDPLVARYSVVFGRQYVLASATDIAVALNALLTGNPQTTASFNSSTTIVSGINALFGGQAAGSESLLFANNGSNAGQITVTIAAVGSGAYVTPSGTTNNTGTQFSITSQNAYNGTLVYNSNGKTGFTVNGLTATQIARFSFYKAASGTVGADNWTKFPSTASLDANGNLQVVALVIGSFSEWTVAQDATTTSNGTNITSSQTSTLTALSTTLTTSNQNTKASSASAMVAGALIVGVLLAVV